MDNSLPPYGWVNTDGKDRVWRMAVLARDGHACQISGAKTKLCVHHIRGRTEHPDDRFVEENGIVLACNLHREFHGRFGVIGFTSKDLLEFATSYGVDLSVRLEGFYATFRAPTNYGRAR